MLGGGGESVLSVMNFASCLDMRITCFYEMLDYKNLEYIFFFNIKVCITVDVLGFLKKINICFSLEQSSLSDPNIAFEIVLL